MAKRYVIIGDSEKIDRIFNSFIGSGSCYSAGSAYRFVFESNGKIPWATPQDDFRAKVLKTQAEFENGRAEESDLVFVDGGMGEVATLFNEEERPDQVLEGIQSYDGVFFVKGPELTERDKRTLEVYKQAGFEVVDYNR